jgi:hypothetical protein
MVSYFKKEIWKSHWWTPEFGAQVYDVVAL